MMFTYVIYWPCHDVRQKELNRTLQLMVIEQKYDIHVSLL